MITLFRRNRVGTQQTSGYATVEDFRRIFTEGMDELYQLSLLLTANRDKAEQCFVEDLEESVNRTACLKSGRVPKQTASLSKMQFAK